MNEHHKDQKENQIKLSGSGYDWILDLAISTLRIYMMEQKKLITVMEQLHIFTTSGSTTNKGKSEHIRNID
jgi:hypothetical protein